MATRLVGAGGALMYQRILVPVDGSECADRGLSEAMSMARLTGGRLRLVHVIDEPFAALGSAGAIGASADLISLAREAAQQILADASAKVRSAGIAVDSVLLDTFDGRLCDLIVDEAKRSSSELLVLGTHGRRGASRFLLGSDAEQIVRVSPVPVLLVRCG